jgi:hypothetical protein
MPSFTWHQKVLRGRVLSTMYGIIGKTQQRYAIRCFNRSDYPAGLLDRRQYQLLSAICALLSDRIEFLATERSLHGVRELWSQLEAERRPVRASLDLISKTLIREGIHNGAILWDEQPPSKKEEYGFSSRHLFGSYWPDWEPDLAQRALSETLYSRIAENESPFVVDVAAEVGDINASTPQTIEARITHHNREKNSKKIGLLLIVPVKLEGSEPRDGKYGRQAALIIPIETAPPESPSFTKMDLLEAIPETRLSFPTYAAIIGKMLQHTQQNSGDFARS